MKENTKTALQGSAIALAVAGMMGCTSATAESTKTAAVNSVVEMGHCYDVNTCKGHNDCKTAENACKGQAVCKGHGFVAMSTKTCGDIGGTVKDDWRGEVNTAELTHCYNINVCKGHNDCKTAENACKGQAACKGHGFVALSASSCADVGGTVGS